MKIGMVLLGVEQLERSIPFYRDLLGFELQGQIPEFAFFNGGAVTLVLSTPSWKANWARPGSTEIVLTVESVRKEFSRLKEKGLTFENEPHVVTGTSWAAHFRDPDGHLFSIFGPE